MTHRLVVRHLPRDREGDEVALHQRAVAPDLRGDSRKMSGAPLGGGRVLQLDHLRFRFRGSEFRV